MWSENQKESTDKEESEDLLPMPLPEVDKKKKIRAIRNYCRKSEIKSSKKEKKKWKNRIKNINSKQIIN